jgi:aspartokinase-like uncharacterized kinase
MIADNPDIPQSWDLTSDSLAAWLANALGAQMLVLVKSVQPDANAISAMELSERGWVDPTFPVMTAQSQYQTRLLNKGQFDVMEHMLVTGMERGTVIKAGPSAMPLTRS